MNPLKLGLRGLEFFWTLLIMALVGNMIHEAFAGNPSIVNFVIFVSVFSMLSLCYLIFVDVKEMSEMKIVPLVLDAINMLLFLIGGIALAAYLGTHSCSNGDYLKNNLVTNGSHNMSKRCREAQASTAFLWFGFACYAASLFFSATSSGTASMPRIRRPGASHV